jgi:hypothetical protein
MRLSKPLFSTFVAIAILITSCNTPVSSPPTSIPGDESKVIIQNEIDGDEVIQKFDIFNCDGKAEVTRSESRSFTVDLTISAELAAKIGASAEVLSAEIQATIGTALGVGKSQETTIEVKAPPGTHMFFELAWVGTSISGTVQNLKGSSVQIPFQSFKPKNVRIQRQYDNGCPSPTSSSNQDTIIPPPMNDSNLICGEQVTGQALAKCIGGKADFWTYRGTDVWGYWDKGNNVTFHHPGNNTILSYWAGFPDPRNAGSCEIIVVQSEDTKYVKCTEKGAEFESDGVGFHIIDHTSIFK